MPASLQVAEPNPQLYDVEREALPLEEAEGIKRTECKLYVGCMNRAIRNDWPQFHCMACYAFKGAEDRKDDIAEIDVPEPSFSMRTQGRAWSSGGRSVR